MREFEAFHEANIERFCEEVLKHEAINIWKMVLTRREKVICVGGSEEMAELYPEAHTEMITGVKTFIVKGLPIVVNDEAIADVLQFIIPSRRNVLLLTYFAGYTDTRIAKMMNITCPTVAYRRKMAEKQMKELLECIGYGKEKDTL